MSSRRQRKEKDTDKKDVVVVDESPPKKKPRLVEEQHPNNKANVQVIVGNETFWEEERKLRYWSDYFDTAFSSGMKEAEGRKFEFPDKNPEDWKFIMKLLANRKGTLDMTKQLTRDNLPIALAWFDFLSVPYGLEQCDRFVAQQFPLSGQTAVLQKVVSTLEHALQYNLAACKTDALQWISQNLLQFANQPQELTKLIQCLHEDAGAREQLWPSIETYLPKDIVAGAKTDGSGKDDSNDNANAKDKSIVSLLANPLLWHLLNTGMNLADNKTKLNRVVEIIEGYSGYVSAENLKSRIRPIHSIQNNHNANNNNDMDDDEVEVFY